MGAAPPFSRQRCLDSLSTAIQPLVLKNEHRDGLHALETPIKTAALRIVGEQSFPPSLPVPGLATIRLTPHTAVEAVIGEEGAFCLGWPCLDSQGTQWLIWRGERGERSDEQRCRIVDKDVRDGLWLSRLEKTGQLQVGIGNESRGIIQPLTAHRRHIRLDAKGTHSLVDCNPGYNVVLSNKDSFDAPQNSPFYLEKLEDDGDAILYRLIWDESKLDAASPIPALFVASRMTFLTMKIISIPCRIEIDAKSDSVDELAMERSIALRLLGKQTARILIFTEGQAAVKEIKLTPERSEQTIAIPNSRIADPISNAIRIETDETLIDRRIHRIPAAKSARIYCWPPLIRWDKAKRAAFGVFQNENDKADWEIIVPEELAEARVETARDDPSQFYIDLPSEGPEPPWTGYLTLRDRVQGAFASIPIVRMGESKR
ncbi:MAG: hypothetical protein AB1656_27240 [Candidatus Omnitrophota bacterium]